VHIFHVTRTADWSDATSAGSYRWSTRDATLDDVGFIHASTQEQVQGTARRIYAESSDDLVVLVIDSEKVEATGTAVVFEDGGNGEMYPHLYGPLAIDAVVDVRPAHFDAAGTLVY